MNDQKQDDPYYGETSGQEPHLGETEQPEGTGQKTASTGTGSAEETGTTAEDAEKAGMRPTGSGGSMPPS